jgi:DNA modification methylase
MEKIGSAFVYIGDCLESLRAMPDKSVHCCVTSPPYWGLRDYRADGQLGLESTPEEYVAKMVEVFREVRRVLRDDGTLWLNLGDSYSGSSMTGGNSGFNSSGGEEGFKQSRQFKKSNQSTGLKPKELVGIPWRMAFALQADGWWLRQDIIWAKPNPMPESVTDRCTKSHEYVFLLSKSAKYFYDADAVKEAAAYPGDSRHLRKDTRKEVEPLCRDNGSRHRTGNPTGETRNRRSVWHISTRPYKGAHFATFPPALVEPCVKAGTSEYGACAECGSPLSRIVSRVRRATRPGADTKVSQAEGGLGGEDRSLVIGNRDPQRHVTETKTEGWGKTCKCETTETRPCIVLDPFGGSGTTGRVASDLGRASILCELNADYIELIRKRMTEPSKPVKKKRQSTVSPLPVNS